MSEQTWRECRLAGDLIAMGSEDYDAPTRRWCAATPGARRIVHQFHCAGCPIPALVEALEAARDYAAEAGDLLQEAVGAMPDADHQSDGDCCLACRCAKCGDETDDVLSRLDAALAALPKESQSND